MSKAPHNTPPHALRRTTIIASGVIFALCVVLTCWYGASHSLLVAFALVLERSVYAGGPPLVYVAGAVGLGRLFRPLFRSATHPLALQSSCGLALSLWLSHLLGWLGAFHGAAGPWVALGVPAFGLLLALQQFYVFIKGGGWEPSLPAISPLLAIPCGLLFGAALFAPGWLWDSEFGGYDALSYHLELPKEWLQLGRLLPLHHNVYSYLPSGVEAAFMQLGEMAWPGSVPGSLTLDEGYRVYACQLLVALGAVLAAWISGAAAGATAQRLGCKGPVGPIASGLALATPWFIVTGSLAYNDGFVVLFLGAALLVAAQSGPGALKQGVLSGLLVGASCIAKPTSLIFVALPIGVLLLVWTPPRAWLKVGTGVIPVGLVIILPWLIRNWQDSGNPLFPFAASLFPSASGGTGAWPPEEVARFARSHAFDGSWGERLRLLVLPDMHDPAGPRHRGLLHPQWGAFFPLVGVCGVIGVLRPSLRKAASVLGSLTLLQLALWLTFTHIQSRFLLPLLVPGAALCAIVIAGISPPGRRGLARFLGGGAVLVQAAFLLIVYASQARGHPAQGFLPGVETYTGADFAWLKRSRSPEENQRNLAASNPARFCNIVLPPTATLYLLGDATPFYHTGKVIYNTTYDPWPFAQAASGGAGPDAITASLRARGITHVLINFSEIDRLSRSGFIDPGVSLDAVQRWAHASTIPLRDWPQGTVLVQLPAADGSAP